MWYVYIVECKDQTYYTGITQNLERRINEHNANNTTGARYTRTRRPVRLVYSQTEESRSKALKREFEIKRLPRETKKKLIMSR